MNKKLIIALLFTLAWFSLQAQNDRLRIAIFDPTSSGTGIDEGTKLAVREIISSAFVNTGKYTIVERSLLEKVMNEQMFSNSGAVDDSQASEIGRLAGANKIVLSVITLAGGRNMLSIKLVDVNTASVERQKTQVITSHELLDVVEPLTMELMGETAVYPTATRQPASQNVNAATAATQIQSTEIEMVYVEGTGRIGSFYIGKYEITQAQWTAIMGNNPSITKGDRYPVENVSWSDAQAFITKLSQMTGRRYRLPTESEWAYAAAGGVNRNTYRYAGSNNIDEVAWYAANSASHRTPFDVGAKRPNALGIHDMTGNVWEWCQDTYKKRRHIIRGGCWNNNASSCLLSKNRSSFGTRNGNVGFRIALSE